MKGITDAVISCINPQSVGKLLVLWVLLYMYIDVVLLTKAVWIFVPITVPPGKGILSKEKKYIMLKKAVCWII